MRYDGDRHDRPALILSCILHPFAAMPVVVGNEALETQQDSKAAPAGTRPTLIICTNCKDKAETLGGPFAGTRLADAAQALAGAEDVEILRVRCLANCSRGPSVAMRHSGTWSYVFGGLDPDVDAPALIDGARLLAGAADGLMPWRGRPDCLKRGLIARMPPLDFTGDPV